MNLDNIKEGDTFSFNVNGANIECTYIGRFDFLYLFNTHYKTLPKVGRIQNFSIAIVNVELLNKYGITKDEAKAMLYHEVGHMISSNQARLDGIEKRYNIVNAKKEKDGLEYE